jgi:beta-glucuronidase
MATSFGLRTIKAEKGRILLNDEPIQLRGYNRHEWHPSGGPATSLQQMVADLQHLLSLGCNFVRGAHYPQDQRFLDLCDQYGILVWEENLGWQQREGALTDPLYHRHHREALEAMIRTSFNHPSVIMWGFLNEAESDKPYSDTLFVESAELVRKLDGSRLLSFASDRPATDRHFSLVDVISINAYPGWYNCIDVDQPLNLVRPALRELFCSLDAKGWSEKPVIISEIGAEAIYGHHDQTGDFFSEEYQAELLALAIREAVENPRCSGIALWQFCDTRSFGGGRSLARPRTFNNKGTMDEYRRPKLAYGRVKELFRQAADLD